MKNETDVYDLLTTPIDPEIEKHLRGMGLDWFFERREKFQKYVQSKDRIEMELRSDVSNDLKKLVELVKKPLDRNTKEMFEAIETYMQMRREWKKMNLD